MKKLQLSYCGEIVREYDADRFLVTMLMPAEKREALWALFAFNYEIAKTREVVSDTTLGLIRLQWWRDSLTVIYDGSLVSSHEILAPLTAAIKQYDLPHELFETLLYAREFDLEDVVPETLEGLEKYADVTTTPLNKLALLIMGDKDDESDNLSKAYALIGLVRAIPFHASQGRNYIPVGCTPVVVLERAGELLKESFSQSKFLSAQKRIATLYLRHLMKHKSDLSSVKAQSRPPFFLLKFLITAFW